MLVLLAAITATYISSWFLSAVMTVFGHEWTTATWQQFEHWGVSPAFAAGYVSGWVMHAPVWIVLAILCFCLGLTRDRRAHLFAWALALFTPATDVVNYLGLTPDIAMRLTLLSAPGAVIGLTAWWAGHVVGGRPAQIPDSS